MNVKAVSPVLFPFACSSVLFNEAANALHINGESP
jgi:hypothetical protein